LGIVWVVTASSEVQTFLHLALLRCMLVSLLLLLLLARVPMGKVTAGNLVLVEGLDALISKTATVVGRHLDEEVHVFKPLRFQTCRWAAKGDSQLQHC
jgi:hypothetical protein